MGPVFFIALHFLIKTRRFQKIYPSESDVEHEKQQIHIAESEVKTKEAHCENLPMLVIVSFKMALSSKVSLLEIISSMSSSCLFARMIITYYDQFNTKPMGLTKKLGGILLLGSFICTSLFSITTFAIVSELDGLFTEYNPLKENSSGLVYILLIFPTVFYSCSPFFIYDLIPFIFNNSLVIGYKFHKPPGRAWYLSIIWFSCVLAYNLMISTYLYKRDRVAPWEELDPYFSECDELFMGLQLPNIICSKYELKFGVGRIYVKYFSVFAGTISLVFFVFLFTYILGMRHRERKKYNTHLRRLAGKKLPNLVSKLSQNDFAQSVLNASSILKEDANVMENILRNKDGKISFNIGPMEVIVLNNE